MKGNKKILVVALLVLLIAVSFTTYAIYRTNFSGTGSLKAAAWSVKLKKGQTELSQNFTFGYDDITWTTLTGYGDTIAPGSSGTITYTVDASGSEVDVIISSAIDSSNLPTGLTVTLAGNATQTINYNDDSKTKDIVLNVAWAGAESDDTTKDGNDLSKQGQTLSIPVTVTAKQSLIGH